MTVNQECIINNNDIVVTENCGEKSLKVIYTNTDQLTNKIDEVSLFLNENNIDIFCVCEDLPKKPGHNISSFIIQGYTCYPCLDGRGVCLFVKNGINTTIVELIQIQNVFKPSIFILHPSQIVLWEWSIDLQTVLWRNVKIKFTKSSC